MNAIDVVGLEKTYRIADRGNGLRASARSLFTNKTVSVRAVDGISMAVEPGEVVGFLGPNGAGKSTTIKMMTGIIRPDAGLVRVNGVDPARNRIQNAQQIGVVFGQRSQLNWDVPVGESLRLVSAIYGVPRNEVRPRIKEMADALDLGELLDKPTRQLSLGQKMRCELGAALLHRPSVVFLDEPTIGLDVHVKSILRDFLLQMNRQHGVTILLTTHDMSDVEALSSRIVAIDHGRVVFDGDLSSLKKAVTPMQSIEFVRNVGWPSELGLVLPVSSRVVKSEGELLVIEFDARKTSSGQIISTLVSRYDVDDVAVHEPSIDSVVAQIYQGALA